MKKLSKILSIILHPVFLPIAFSFLVYFSDYYFNFFLKPSAFQFIFLTLVGFTFVLPFVIIFILRHLKIIESWEMKSSNERIFAIVIFFVAVYMVYKVVRKLNLPFFYTDYFLIFILEMLLSALITVFYRISLHTIGWGTVTGLVVGYIIKYGVSFYAVLPIVILLSGAVAWSRLEQNAHNNSQIYLGYILGFLSVFYFLF